MSEVMEQGVLRMPPHLWTGDPLDVMQRHAHYVAAADELERLRQELAAAEQERDRHFSARGRLVGERDALAADLAAARALLRESLRTIYQPADLRKRIDAVLAAAPGEK